MHNGNNRRQGPPPGKGMNAGEKPKDFKNSIVRNCINIMSPCNKRFLIHNRF